MNESITLDPGSVTLSQFRAVLETDQRVAINPSANERVDRGRAVVVRLLTEGGAIYGVNTGFGKLANVAIEEDKLAELQRNLVLSHSVGTGDLLDDGTVRLILAMKACALARGFSGVRWELIEQLVGMVNTGALPAIPAKGSVGASGDLAPLAHMAAALIGHGRIRYRGELLPAREGLARAGLEPAVLGPKEGVALINGTQVSTALALHGVFRGEDLLHAGIVTGALSLEACKGSDTPYDPRIQAVRGHPGQMEVAAAAKTLLAGSAIRESHRDCERVQDPYCLRCQPQVTGACLDQLRGAAHTLWVEANGVTDNPMVFPDDAEVISGGNFHAEPVAFAADAIALALAELGSISERRQALMVDASLSGLPPFLTENSGLHSGFMMTQVTAAALVSENKCLSVPSSVDSIPTSANQEDHVSMATYAARRLLQMAENLTDIIAIEWMTAAQGVEFHAPRETSAVLGQAIARLREVVPVHEGDRFLADDIGNARRRLLAGDLRDLCPVLSDSLRA
jgi:histidine ammonia-lyase